MEPMPTPIANTLSNSVSTLLLACSVSRATTGNSVSSVAPIVQNQDRPRSDSQIGRIAAAWRSTFVVSDSRLSDRRSVGSAAGTLGRNHAAARPISDSATPVALTTAAPFDSSISAPPATVPMTMARKVVASITPLPATSSSAARCSGRMPYLTGPNRVACTPSKNSTASKPETLAVRKVAAATSISRSSRSL